MESESAVVKRLKMSTDAPGDSSSSSSSEDVSMEGPQQAETRSKEVSTRSFFPEKNEGKGYGRSEFHYEQLMHLPSYVDKTLFIKAFFDVNEMTLITAPRRFGKSANMDMLRRFVEIQTDDNGEPFELKVQWEGLDDEVELEQEQKSPNFCLFKDKMIFNFQHIFKKHFGQYPVINVDFKSVGGTGQTLKSLRGVLYRSFKQHGYLAESKKLSDSSKAVFKEYSDTELHKTLSEEQITEGLEHLSDYLFQHFNKRAFVFIDEFDAPIFDVIHHASKENSETLWVKDSIKSINAMISSLLKNNDCVANALLTGCHHVGNILLQDAHNIQHESALQSDSFCNFYGFTGKEVKKLLEDNHLLGQSDEVRHWYNGYRKMLGNGDILAQQWYNAYRMKFGDGDCVEIYRNSSVLSYLKHKKTECYWNNGAFAQYHMLLQHNKILDKCRDILTKEAVKIQYREFTTESIVLLNNMIAEPTKAAIGNREVDLFLQFLYEIGYLSVAKATNNTFELEVPNQEIRELFAKAIFTMELVTKWFNLEEQAIQSFIQVFEHVIRNEPEASWFDALTNCTKDLFKGQFPRNEFQLHAALYTILKDKLQDSTVTFQVSTSSRVQFRCGIVAVVEPKQFEADKIGMVFEIKFGAGTDSEAALKQIVDNSYYDVLEGQEIVHKFLFGVHMAEDGKIAITYLKKSNSQLIGKSS